ncbi:MAG: hypothetical protein JOZ36_04770, partial [Acidobacteria bacterium]|nr:hypothetical protein [Acidobacteriota bacterium]
MALRAGIVRSLAAVVLIVAVPRRTVDPEPSRTDPLQEAKRLAWLYNWAEAAQVLRRSGFKPTDEAAAVFSEAAEIRGNIESTSLPEAAKEIASLLTSLPARRDVQLRLELLAIKGDIEYQYNLPAAQKTWEEAKQLAATTGLSQWEARSEGELGTIAFLNGEVFTATKLVTEAFLKAELSGDVAARIRYCTDLGEGFAEYGRSADAIRFFNKALGLAAATPGAYFPFTAYLGKARLLATNGHEGEGLRMLRNALDEAHVKNLRVREAKTLTVLGELESAKGRREEAIASLTSAADVAQSAGLDLIEADASSALASLLRDVGRADGAEDYARRSVAAAERAGDLYHLPQLTAVLAEIEENNGNLARAEADYSRATDLVGALLKGFPQPRNKNILVATMGRVYQGHFDLAINRSKDLARAFEILESARAYGLVDVLREPTGARRHLSVLDADLAPKIAAVNRDLSHAQDLGLRNRLLDHLWELEIQALHPHELSASSYARPVSLHQFQSCLSEGDLAIEYTLESSHSFALAITRNRIARYELKGRAQLESAAEAFLAAI